MKFFACLGLRKRRNQNPNFQVSERNEETEEEEPSEWKRDAEDLTITPTTSLAVAVRDGPPTDDCCPICFGSFVAACQAQCGHWYCGGCILQYWNYGSALRPCKCPMCFRQITKLKPETSLYHQQEVEVTDILKNVQKYNRLFVGGTYGLILKVLQLPLIIKRVFQGMMDPDRPFANYHKLRFLAIFLAALYTHSSFRFLPTERLTVMNFFDYLAMAITFILYLVGLYLRRRRLQHVRQLAAVQL